MNAYEFLTAVKCVEDEILTLLAAEDCGPFDGGCLAVAIALQTVIGGEVYVLVRQDGTADHAVVMKDGKLWDFRGPRLPSKALALFNHEELSNSFWVCTGYRPISGDDLPEAIRDESVIASLVNLLGRVLTL